MGPPADFSEVLNCIRENRTHIDFSEVIRAVQANKVVPSDWAPIIQELRKIKSDLNPSSVLEAVSGIVPSIRSELDLSPISKAIQDLSRQLDIGQDFKGI